MRKNESIMGSILCCYICTPISVKEPKRPPEPSHIMSPRRPNGPLKTEGLDKMSSEMLQLANARNGIGHDF